MLQPAKQSRLWVLSCVAFASAIGLLSCSVIAGSDNVSPSDSEHHIQLDYVETLINQSSLQGRSMQLAAATADPATSLVRPHAVYADAFRVYVADLYTGGTVSAPRLFVFDRGTRTATIVPVPVAPAEGALLEPSAVVVSADTLLFVADAQQGRVFGYDRKGNLLIALGRGGDLVRPVALALDARRNRLYVADSHANRVAVYTTLGERIFDIGGTGSGGAGGLRSPSGVALDGDGRVYVLDSHDRRVHVYDPEGRPIEVFSVSSGVPGGPWQPKAIAVDSARHIYVTDTTHNTVLIFDREGRFLSTWGRTGSYMGDFWTPAGIFIDARDMIYIADQTNSRIQVYQFSR